MCGRRNDVRRGAIDWAVALAITAACAVSVEIALEWRWSWLFEREPFVDQRSAIQSGRASTGSDAFFLGGLARDGSSSPRAGGGAAGPASPGPAGGPGGSYRGPGNTVPPGSPGPRLAPGAGAQAPVALEPIEDLDRLLADLSPGLSPEALEAEIAERVRRVLQSSRPRPDERPGAMFFRCFGDNPFELAQLDPRSTFAADVDTASYALVRRYLRDGYLPEKAAVRTEEFVNYFEPDVPAPREGVFAVRAELAPSHFGDLDAAEAGAGESRWMLRIAIRGREVSRAERQPLALSFVVDTSGSMEQGARLELVKHALRLLVAQLDARDSIGIVAFSDQARVVLPPTSGAQRGRIELALASLRPGGGTNAEAGLRLGYDQASAQLSRAALSRVVLLSDGVANIGQTDQQRLNASVRRQRAAGIYLNTIGVGMTNHDDAFLEQLADEGDGVCNYVDSELEARRALVENFTGAFEPIARDVKVQVEFDSTQVFRYRLLGYENRAVADQDFRNDAVDAGEIGAGHQVTALYELELLGAPTDALLATVRLRWKQPSGAGRHPLEDAAQEDQLAVFAGCATPWEGATAGYKRSVLVAQFAEVLRQSVHARGDSLEALLFEVGRLERELSDPDFFEFHALIRRYRDIVRARGHRASAYEACVGELRRHEVLRAQCEELSIAREGELARELELRGRELERRLHGLMREYATKAAR